MLKASKIVSRQSKIIVTSSVRSKHSNEGLKLQPFVQTSSKSSFHQSGVQEYPATKHLPLPSNIEYLPSSENLKFSPRRNREITGSLFSVNNDTNTKSGFSINDVIECYDCSGTVSLSSAMQTNVPYPFYSKGKPTHLNMPGGQWAQDQKYTSESLNKVHPSNTQGVHTGGTCTLGFKRGNKQSYLIFQSSDLSCYGSQWPIFSINQYRNFCSVKDKQASENQGKTNSTVESSQLTPRQKLKDAVKVYGPAIIIFHISISLISLGCWYMLVSSGVDLSVIIKQWGVDEGAATAGTAAQFVLAYALHKTTAPARIFCSLTAGPLLVKKLRKMGVLKTPKPQK